MQSITEASSTQPAVKILSIVPSRKQAALVDLILEIEICGSIITIADARLLKNKLGELWLSMPNYAIQTGGREYRYEPSVTLSQKLKTQVTDAAFAAYEAWSRSHQSDVISAAELQTGRAR